MKTQSKTALVAAFLFASASGAFAASAANTFAEVEYLTNPNAPVPEFQNVRPQAPSRLIEGRNVGVQFAPNPAAPTYGFDRSADTQGQ